MDNVQVGDCFKTISNLHRLGRGEYNILIAPKGEPCVVYKITKSNIFIIFENGQLFKHEKQFLDLILFESIPTVFKEYNFILLEEVYEAYRVVLKDETFNKKHCLIE